MVDTSSQIAEGGRPLIAVMVWSLGLSTVLISFALIRQTTVNVVNYEFEPIQVPPSWIPFLAPGLSVLAVGLLGALRSSRLYQPSKSGEEPGSAEAPSLSAGRAALPLGLTAAVGAVWLAGSAPTFVTFCLAVLGVGWSIDRLGAGLSVPKWRWRSDRLAPILLLVGVGVSTVWHTLMQMKFWQHFLLGYADFGFFTTELEHCLPWKEVGAARFADTRMGYHCEPMFYLLAPFYAPIRSPVFLMVVGPLALNLAAIPFYQLAKHRSGSATVALLVALAWLALPSVSRMPYANTYGFESVFLAVPWLALMVSLALRERWCGAHLCLAAAILCQETICGVAFGWGVYLIVFSKRRRDGIWIAVISLLYLFLCMQVIIPHFAASSHYVRLSLFGEITPGEIIARLTRSRVALYVLALMLPLAPALWRGRRLLLAILPPLLLIFLLQDEDYLNIKYWHQSSVLPVVFAAATVGVTKSLKGRDARCPTRRASVGPPLGMLVAVLLIHQWTGSSPIAQVHRLHQVEPRLQTPDPRMVAVEYVRANFRPQTTVIIATERMAAHFTDYRVVYPAAEVHLDADGSSPHVLIVDRTDGWDKLVREQRLGDLLTRAASVGYEPVHVETSVLILARVPVNQYNSK